MSKHTKGPWFNEGTQVYTKQSAFYIANAISNKSKNSYTKSEEEAFANAQLIAAAPELLEALKIAFEMHKDNLSTHDERLKVMAHAIFKATGEDHA